MSVGDEMLTPEKIKAAILRADFEDLKFMVCAHADDPNTRSGYERGNIVTYEIKANAQEAAIQAARYLERGYWVEIYLDKPHLLLTGPLNPDTYEVAA